MTIISVLYAMGLSYVFQKKMHNHLSFSDSGIFSEFAISIILLLCPIIGVVSDSYFGRYKIFIVSMHLWLIAIIF